MRLLDVACFCQKTETMDVESLSICLPDFNTSKYLGIFKVKILGLIVDL